MWNVHAKVEGVNYRVVKTIEFTPTTYLGGDVYLIDNELTSCNTDSYYLFCTITDSSKMRFLAKAKHYKGITTVYGLGRPVYMGYGKITNYLSEILP